MENPKNFTISQHGESTWVNRTNELGRILFRPEVNEIAARFGSTVLRTGGETVISIIPPLPDEDLPKLGEALVNLAKNLDSSEPEPTFTIN